MNTKKLCEIECKILYIARFAALPKCVQYINLNTCMSLSSLYYCILISYNLISSL